METQLAATAAPAPTQDDPTIWRVDDALWAALPPLLRVDKPRKKAGRQRNDDRPSCDGRLWLARTGAPWAAWPRARFGARSTAHDRPQEGVEHGCLARAWARLRAVYDDDVALDGQWQAAAGGIVQAPLGKKGGPVPRRRPARSPRPGAHAAPNGPS